MKNYYRVKIEDVYDIMRKINFLEKLHPDLFKLVQQREIISNFYGEMDKRVVKIDLKFPRILKKYHLPRYLIFEGEDDDRMVREFFSKKEVFLSSDLLNRSKLTINYSHKLSTYFDEYSDEELKKVFDSFPGVFQDQKKTDIISFSNSRRRK